MNMSLLLKLIDRIAHPSTLEDDRDRSLKHLQQMIIVDNVMPGDFIRKDRQEVIEETAEIMAELDDMTIENKALREELGRHKNGPVTDPVDGYYSCEQVNRILNERWGKQNVKVLWAEYTQQLRDDDPILFPEVLTLSRLQVMRINNAYPVWCVDVLKRMPVLTRQKIMWTDIEIDFLCELYLHSRKGDAALANVCAIEFNRHINTNMIKSQLHRLRRDERIPRSRRGPFEPYYQSASSVGEAMTA